MSSELTRWALTGSFATIFLGCFATNLSTWIVSRRQGTRASYTLLLGGLSGAAAFLVAPVEGAKYLAWIPILLDPGTLMPLLAATKRRH